MGKALWGWVCWFLFLIIIDLTIPFYTLKGIQRVTGSFLFWIVWMAVAIASMFAIFLRWREGGKKG